MTALARAAIIAVGSELLTPSRIDTNSLFITTELNALGIDVVFKAIAGDDRQELVNLLRHALSRVDLVICCGGLGPTDDDVTRDAAAEVTGCELREDLAITERLRARFAARFSGTMPEINRRQAMVPAGATVLENTTGSAPGLWLEHDGHVLVLVPGPPREMKPMVGRLVAGPLAGRVTGQKLVRRVLMMAGRIESQTEEQLRPLYEQWRGRSIPIEATILAALGQLELHLSARAAPFAAAASALAVASDDVVKVLGADVFSTEGKTLEAVVGELLVTRGARIALAESCTGGLIASRLTDVPGSSRYLDRGVVVYSNQAKVELLGVPAPLIEAHGAVSEPVAMAMAEGAKSLAGVDIGVGVTGIAGPDGGTAQKPVGTVAIAAVVERRFQVRTFRFGGEREQVKFQASQAALDMVRRMLLA
jgi:nicotinamide-nucleotide amidase